MAGIWSAPRPKKRFFKRMTLAVSANGGRLPCKREGATLA